MSLYLEWFVWSYTVTPPNYMFLYTNGPHRHFSWLNSGGHIGFMQITSKRVANQVVSLSLIIQHKKIHKCAKFHAFNTKCTILCLNSSTNKLYFQSVTINKYISWFTSGLTSMENLSYELFFWNCSQTKATEKIWWQVNLSLVNGLMPSSNKPLPEPALTQILLPYGVARPQWVNSPIP